MAPHTSRVVALLLLLGLMGCRAGRVPITLASDPPGAVVWVNGRDSGFATPCRISLEDDSEHDVQLVLPGYRTATRRVVPGGERETYYWSEMSVGMRTWNFPLFLNIHDFFEPVPLRHPLVPGRIFVRLRREADDA